MSEKIARSFVSAPVMMEPLEPRTLLSLLGVAALLEVPDINYDSTGVVNYAASTTVFESTAVPTSFIMTKGARPIQVQAPRLFHLKIQVDNNGNFLGGFADDDLRVEGQVDLDNDGIMEFDGVLLTARAVAFGYLNGTSTDQYDFRLIPTGGDLLPYFEGKDVGMRMTSLNSNFQDDFGVDFNGRSQGILGPISAMYGSLSGNVYADSNNNGVNDGEAGIEGATVSLTGSDVTGAPVSQTVATDVNGSYSFGQLRPGTYTISEVQPGNLLNGTNAAGSVGGIVDGDTIGSIALALGQNGTGYTFGEIAPASLAGSVTSDGNAIAGVTITLTGSDDLGAVGRTIVTGADGSFTFDNLRPGTYALAETQPAGLLDGNDAAGSLGGTAGDDSITDIAVAQGDSGTGYAFTEIAPASLSGGVFLGGVGIADVTITLTGIDDLGGSVSLTATTGLDGGFAFAGLRPGTYALAEAQPTGYLDGDDAAGSLGGVVADDFISEIAVGQGQDGAGYTFNEIEGSSIQGLVWEDFNNDGEVDFSEKAIAGVTIELTGTDDRGNAVSRTVVTDEDGMYAFGDLRPSNAGGYTIQEIQPGGWNDGLDVIGMLDGIAVGSAVANDRIAGITITQPSSHAINYNFAELVNAGGAVIGSGQTATIGYWQNKNGQALIKSLNGGQYATQLGNWLAATFPNLYGNLAGKTNAQVAQYYLDIFKGGKTKGAAGPAKLDAQIMAVALATYVTNSTLAGTTAVAYGFKVDEYGVGVKTIDVGLNGYAFGVENYSVQTVLELLWATNASSVDGRIYDTDGNGITSSDELLMKTLANAMYTLINELGHIA